MPTQSQLQPLISTTAPLLEFDFPGLRIGCAEYAEGPTGATVFWFPDRALAAVDVRGGAPGSYNLDWLRLGYDFPSLDAITISGGSWYGLGTAAGVAARLKERGHRTGHWANLANVAGAIIYDYGARRLTSYHPDERLGAAALDAAVAGHFPLGAAGAGRNTMQGSYFGLWLHSGQGGAFRQVGDTKIACFSVVNSVGAVTDRQGRLAMGSQTIATGERTIQDLIRQVPERISSGDDILSRRNPANTTISVVVTNQALNFAELQRLAVQVHTSMGRAIQPLATANDGDILFAVSTCELRDSTLDPTDLGVVASEVMWDAVLASVPKIKPVPDRTTAVAAEQLAGHYAFSPEVGLDVAVEGERLRATVRGARDVFAIPPQASLLATRQVGNSFLTDHPLLRTLRFVPRKGGGARLLLNPGPWQQVSLEG